LTDKIVREFKQDIEGYTLVPSSGGVFEVFRNGTQIYSKDETGEFPDEEEIIEALR